MLTAAALLPQRASLLLASVTYEPSSWSEWTLRDVGQLDASAIAILAAGTYMAAAGCVDEKSPDETVQSAEKALRESIEYSPCNGPSMELLEALEAADSNAAKPETVVIPSEDPNELPSIFQRWTQSGRGGSPEMAAPKEALSDIVIPSIDDTDDERLWVPQTDCLSFRPLCLCVSQGYYVNLLRFQGGGTLGCHRHSSPVHAHTIKGRWGYKEHGWEAKVGTYVFEPPGETHTLVVHEDEMIALFHVTGALLYCDPEQPEVVTGFDDVFTKLEKAKAHYERVGLGASYVDQFVR